MVSVQDTLIPFKSNLNEGDELSSQIPSLQSNDTQITQWILGKKISQIRGIIYWKARHERYSEVIFKTIWPHVLSEDAIMWRFSTEMEIERQYNLDDPGIQKVWEWGYDEARGVWWIAYEKIKGLRLADLIKSQPLSWVDARALFMTLSECVKTCHKAELLHRKINPEAIYLTQDGARLAHFQWVEEVKADEVSIASRLLKAGHNKQAPTLQAPEWLDGAEINSASDVYALAATLLVSLVPEGKTWRDAPAPFKAAIASGLHINPNARTSIDEFYESLRLSSLSFAYRGTQDDESQRLWLHEIVDRVREDSLAWHMLSQPHVLPSFEFSELPDHLNVDHETLDQVEFQAWGTFEEVVKEVEKANHFQAKQDLQGYAEQQKVLQNYAQQLLLKEESLTEEEKVLQKKLADYEQRVADETTKRDDQYQKQLQALQTAEQNLQESEEDFKQRATAWDNAYKGARSIIEQAQKEKQKAQNALRILADEQKALQDEQKSLQEKQEYLAYERQLLEQERSQFTENKQNLDLQLQVMQRDLKKSRDNRESLQSELRILQNQIHESQNNITSLREVRETVLGSISDVEDQHTQSKKQLMGIQEQTTKAHQDFIEAKKELDKVRLEADNLNRKILQEKEDLQHTHSELSAQQASEKEEIQKLINLLEQQRTQLKKEKELLHAQEHARQAENEKLQKIVEQERIQMTQEKSALELRQTALDEKVQNYRNQLQTLQKEKKNLQQNKSDLRQTAQTLSQEKSKHQEVLLKVKTLKQDTEIAFEAAQNTQKRAEQTKLEAEREARDLKESLLESQMHLREDRKSLNQQKEVISQEKHQVREQSRQLDLLKLELESQAAQLASDTSKIEEIKQELKMIAAQTQLEKDQVIQAKLNAEQAQSEVETLLYHTQLEQKAWQQQQQESQDQLQAQQEESEKYLVLARDRAQEAHAKEVSAQEVLQENQKQQEKLDMWETSIQDTQNYLTQETNKLNEIHEAQDQRTLRLERKERVLLQKEEELQEQIKTWQSEKVAQHIPTYPKSSTYSKNSYYANHYQPNDSQRNPISINPDKEHRADLSHLSELEISWNPKTYSILNAGSQRVLSIGGQSMVWIYCPAGQQWLGNHHPEAKKEEKPSHLVHLSQGYWLAQTAVTQRIWNLIMGSNKSEFQHNDYPVEGITWVEAILFCNRLSHLMGLHPFYQLEKGLRPVIHSNWGHSGMRLPTEAEWEYAARSNQVKDLKYAGSSRLDEIAWYSKNAQKSIQAVGLKKPNLWGFYDFCGNIWEWCHDAWHKEAYRYRTHEKKIVDPYYEQSQWSARVVRGGSFYDFSSNCTVYTRPGLEANSGYGVGFRPYLPLVP